MHRGSLRSLAAGATAALIAATFVAGAAPARADVTHHTPFLLDAVSLVDGSPAKEVVVHCPDRTSLFSAGGRVTGPAAGTGQVVIVQVVPDAQLTQVTVRAVARNGYTGAWSLTGQAICEASSQPMRRVASTTVGQRDATATCGNGTKVFGTGFRIVGDPSLVFVNAIVPDADLTRVRVRAAGSMPAEVTAYAVCRAPSDRMQRITTVSPAQSEWPRALLVPDSEQEHVYGVGGSAGPGAFLDGLVLRPDNAGGGIRAVLAGPVNGRVDGDDSTEDSEAYGVLLGSFH
jgi:hypothetical protein